MTMLEELETVAQGITGAYDARIQGIAHLREAVHGHRQATQVKLKELDKDRQATTYRLHAELSRGRTDLKDSVDSHLREMGEAHQSMARQLRSGLAQHRGDLKVGVSAELTALGKAHQSMTRQLRSGLAKGRADRARAEARRNSEVNTWMKDIVTAHAGAGKVWQGLVATMHAKRNGASVVGQRNGDEELASRSKQVFEYLAQHPDGTRLTELQDQFGMKRFEATRTLKRLMDEGKVEKRDLLYFAV